MVENKKDFDSLEMVKNLVRETKQNVEHFVTQVDYQKFADLVDSLYKIKGTIFFTGIGKSGAIAKKVAMTMSSCGIHSLYLSPVNAIHGDLGIVANGDAILFFSKSGESDELLQLCPAIRNKGVEIIAIVSNSESRLVAAADKFFVLPLLRELCPFDLAPTTSTVLQLIFGDVLAIALMNKKEFPLSEYVINHPAGRIGKRLTLRVHDLMCQGARIPRCLPDEKLVNVLVELSTKKCGCVLVSENSVLCGIFTDGDLSRGLQKNGAKVLDMQIKDLMTKNPRTISSYELAYEAMKQMENNQKSAITVMPVVDNNELVGLIRLHDIIQSGI